MCTCADVLCCAVLSATAWSLGSCIHCRYVAAPVLQALPHATRSTPTLSKHSRPTALPEDAQVTTSTQTLLAQVAAKTHKSTPKLRSQLSSLTEVSLASSLQELGQAAPNPNLIDQAAANAVAPSSAAFAVHTFPTYEPNAQLNVVGVPGHTTDTIPARKVSMGTEAARKAAKAQLHMHTPSATQPRPAASSDAGHDEAMLSLWQTKVFPAAKPVGRQQAQYLTQALRCLLAEAHANTDPALVLPPEPPLHPGFSQQGMAGGGMPGLVILFVLCLASRRVPHPSVGMYGTSASGILRCCACCRGCAHCRLRSECDAGAAAAPVPHAAATSRHCFGRFHPARGSRVGRCVGRDRAPSTRRVCGTWSVAGTWACAHKPCPGVHGANHWRTVSGRVGCWMWSAVSLVGNALLSTFPLLSMHLL